MKEIKNYAVRFYGGPNEEQSGTRAQIFLFDKENSMMGIVNFKSQGWTIPNDEKDERRITFSMPIQELAPLVDILRNESPVYLGWQEKGQKALISTSQEPVGEGEM